MLVRPDKLDHQGVVEPLVPTLTADNRRTDSTPAPGLTPEAVGVLQTTTKQPVAEKNVKANRIRHTAAKSGPATGVHALGHARRTPPAQSRPRRHRRRYRLSRKKASDSELWPDSAQPSSAASVISAKSAASLLTHSVSDWPMYRRDKQGRWKITSE